MLAVDTSPASAANTAYVFAYFTESTNRNGSNYGPHLAVSQDVLSWTPLNQNNPVVTPAACPQGPGNPFILRKQHGTFPNSYTTYTGGLRQGSAMEAPMLVKNNSGTNW